MIRSRSSRILFALALCASAAGAQAVRKGLPGAKADSTSRKPRSGTIDGIVTDTALAPIQAAQVTVLSTAVKVGTGPNGRFRITEVPAGEYVLIVKRLGYRPVSTVVTVAQSDTLRVSYALEPQVATLGTAVVTERSASMRVQEFEQRRRFGIGEFMTQEEIEKRGAVFATELMRKFQSINVSPSYTKGSGAEWFALSKRETGSLAVNPGACPMTVLVDQIPMPTPFNLDLLPSPKALAGIEVYNGPATIPPQFNSYNSTCGIILIWTRDGS